MSNLYDTTSFLTTVKLLPMVPQSQALLSDDDILRLANQELKTFITPQIQSVVEEYFCDAVDYTVTPDDSTITIPSYASGLRLREVYWLNQPGGDIQRVAYRLQPEQLGFANWGFIWNSPNTAPYGNPFYLQGNQLIFYPKLSSNGYVRVVYMRIPNDLVEVDAGVTVASVTSPNTFNSVDSPPADWASLPVGTELDVISPTLPFPTKRRIQLSGLSGDLFYVNDPDDWAAIAPGDYVYLAGQAPVIQLVPQEAFYVLTQATAVKVLETVGDLQGLQVARQSLADGLNGLLKLISPRAVGTPKKITNRQSVFSQGRLWGNWSWFR